MTWPLALLAGLFGLGMWTPRSKDHRFVIALAVIAVALVFVYSGLGSPPPAIHTQ